MERSAGCMESSVRHSYGAGPVPFRGPGSVPGNSEKIGKATTPINLRKLLDCFAIRGGGVEHGTVPPGHRGHHVQNMGGPISKKVVFQPQER